VSNATCSEDGCSRPVVGWGWCSVHYNRWYHAMRKGEAPDIRLSVEERLLAKRVINSDGCWVWTGCASNGNHSATPYGYMSVDGRETVVHRIAHEVWIGPIPDGLDVDHVIARGCRSTLCFNPAHLEAVTPRVNVLRGIGPSAINAAKTTCNQGHPFDEANTYTRPSGKRDCRICNRRRVAEWRAARLSGEVALGGT
jgi:hypothetical protein